MYLKDWWMRWQVSNYRSSKGSDPTSYIREISAKRRSYRIEMVLMESKDYERHFETIIIPPAHVALRCENRLPIWEQ
jgi:hypothetical protein